MHTPAPLTDSQSLTSRLDTYAACKLSMGEIDGKTLVDRVYFHNNERLVDIKEGSQWSVYTCLAGCINKKTQTHDFKISLQQGPGSSSYRPLLFFHPLQITV